jgi:hypothetical protein
MYGPGVHLAILASQPIKGNSRVAEDLPTPEFTRRFFTVQIDVFYSSPRHDCSMTIIQLLITGIAVVGVIVIVLLAIIPSLLEYPRGRDQDESDTPAPTPIKPDDHRDDPIDLAA